MINGEATPNRITAPLSASITLNKAFYKHILCSICPFWAWAACAFS